MLTLKISGQIRGGKNNMIVLRNGMHIPKKEWAQWRDRVVFELKEQAKGEFIAPLAAEIRYTPGDRRRRDVPAIIDAIWHCLERAGIVADDCMIQDVVFVTLQLDRKQPCAEIVLRRLDALS